MDPFLDISKKFEPAISIFSENALNALAFLLIVASGVILYLVKQEITLMLLRQKNIDKFFRQLIRTEYKAKKRSSNMFM